MLENISFKQFIFNMYSKNCKGYAFLILGKEAIT